MSRWHMTFVQMFLEKYAYPNVEAVRQVPCKFPASFLQVEATRPHYNVCMDYEVAV